MLRIFKGDTSFIPKGLEKSQLMVVSTLVAYVINISWANSPMRRKYIGHVNESCSSISEANECLTSVNMKRNQEIKGKVNGNIWRWTQRYKEPFINYVGGGGW